MAGGLVTNDHWGCSGRRAAPSGGVKLKGAKIRAHVLGRSLSSSANLGGMNSREMIGLMNSRNDRVTGRKDAVILGKAAATTEEIASNGNGTTKRKKVVVVGSGWAGLGAAHHLSKQVKYLVLSGLGF